MLYKIKFSAPVFYAFSRNLLFLFFFVELFFFSEKFFQVINKKQTKFSCALLVYKIYKYLNIFSPLGVPVKSRVKGVEKEVFISEKEVFISEKEVFISEKEVFISEKEVFNRCYLFINSFFLSLPNENRNITY